ncbi:hypothetical protein JCM18904_170 [Vibrio sp. JCM 18904]|nr:hypothetical protein JCM18904_170 [Vibrio sp. JCM 18904]
MFASRSLLILSDKTLFSPTKRAHPPLSALSLRILTRLHLNAFQSDKNPVKNP